MSQIKYPLLTGNRNKTTRYHYSPSEQLNLSIFNLDSHTLDLKIVYQTPEIQACKVKIYSAPETRGFVKGPRPDMISQALHSIPSVKKRRKEHMHIHFGDVARLYHS